MIANRKTLCLIALTIPLFWGVTGCESREEKIARIHDEYKAEMARIEAGSYPTDLARELKMEAIRTRIREWDRLGYRPGRGDLD